MTRVGLRLFLSWPCHSFACHTFLPICFSVVCPLLACAFLKGPLQEGKPEPRFLTAAGIFRHPQCTSVCGVWLLAWGMWCSGRRLPSVPSQSRHSLRPKIISEAVSSLYDPKASHSVFHTSEELTLFVVDFLFPPEILSAAIMIKLFCVAFCVKSACLPCDYFFNVVRASQGGMTAHRRHAQCPLHHSPSGAPVHCGLP